ncbi:uncharacterized protein GIQ15_04588 [Arthroderma uncinatum]|uniref:uncharacterized protein n=1 Tax=Arthroderma uncinatum TaxID=74035 RepID=UPI00144A7DD4|nr:uncharacterized protein GIQ15_04588 [Arthroderma uncinatum]KAF3481829.1 hypothetical protein GIQ15_04588 [Arthroderma uncinatum]
MRLEEEKWGSFYHLGDLAEASPEEQELVEALTHSLVGGKGEQPLMSDFVHRMNVVPNFRLLRSGKPDMSLTDLIKIEGQLSLEDEAFGPFNGPYWIGDEAGQGGLGVNLEKKIATLRSGENNGSDSSWEVAVQNPRMDIFTVNSVKKKPQNESTVTVENSPKCKPYPPAENLTIDVNELKKRIQGFGPR